MQSYRTLGDILPTSDGPCLADFLDGRAYLSVNSRPISAASDATGAANGIAEPAGMSGGRAQACSDLTSQPAVQPDPIALDMGDANG
jgi:hypothetical protein